MRTTNKFILTIVSLAAMLSACAANVVSAPDAAPTETCETRTSHVHFSADPSFTAEERADLEGGSLEWASLSNGRMSATFEWREGRVGEPHISRRNSSDKVVQDADVRAAEAFKIPGFEHAGWSGEGPNVYLVVDRLTRETFRIAATHELGHALGLRWPDCKPGEDCFHSADASALMCGVPRAKHCDSVSKPSAADLEYCRASCLCDRE